MVEPITGSAIIYLVILPISSDFSLLIIIHRMITIQNIMIFWYKIRFLIKYYLTRSLHNVHTIREYILPSENIFSKTNEQNKIVILRNNDLENKSLVSINNGVECVLIGLIRTRLIIINVRGIVYKCVKKYTNRVWCIEIK